MERNLQNTLVSFILTVSILSSKSQSRDLRPSEHGLPYPSSSTPTTKSNDPELHSFFAGAGGNTARLPEGSNVTSWWNNNNNTYNGDDGMSRDGRKNHLREVLLVSSLVCGAAGVILLAISAFVFVVRLRKKKRETSSSVPNLVKGTTSIV